MSDIAIQVDGLGKRYRIGRQRGYGTLREAITAAAAHPFRRLASARAQATAKPDAPSDKNHIWALKDVSFEVKQGEVLGVIGRNGSGKSTLLKILSRITEPTKGTAEIHGRVGSLLEVGTGFHPELTGRENILLNGVILGMKKVEIRRKFDEIVDFSETGKFVDTPVKRYSSGMYVRLAFAVAAHLGSEILLVDEVLAVGDAEFQARCLGKMSDVATAGRTIVFVSHNTQAIEQACASTLLLRDGCPEYLGPTREAVDRYLNLAGATSGGGVVDLTNHPGRQRACKPVIRALRLLSETGNELDHIVVGEPVVFSVELDPGSDVFSDCELGLGIFGARGELVVPFRTRTQYLQRWSLNAPRTVEVVWQECVVAPGKYVVTLALASQGTNVDWIDNAVTLEVRAGSARQGATDLLDTSGLIVPHARWRFGDRHIQPEETTNE